MPVPTDLPARQKPVPTSDLGPIVLFSIVPGFVTLLLVHYSVFAGAYVLLGQVS